MQIKYISILFMSLLIGGCSSDNDKKIPEQSSKPSIFKEQLEALEKAKELEQVIQLGVDKRRQDLDKQSQ